jgi:hypothetical protein
MIRDIKHNVGLKRKYVKINIKNSQYKQNDYAYDTSRNCCSTSRIQMGNNISPF